MISVMSRTFHCSLRASVVVYFS